MKERDEIAALFKDRLEHHTEPVDPAVWTKVQSGLAGKTIGGAAAASKLGVIIKAIAVTSILVGSVIGVGYLLQNPEKGSSNNEGQNINNTPIGQENQTKMSDFEPAASLPENPEAIRSNSTGSVMPPTESNQDLNLEQAATLIARENPNDQVDQGQSIAIATVAVPIAPTNTKSVDSKINSNQNPIETPITTTEKAYKNLLMNEIPNIFTPNGDGKNDLFNIPIAENVTHSTKVFNQNGELMVEFSQESTGWDGTKTGGAEASNGTYFYVTFVSDHLGNHKQLKGTVNLLR